MAKDLITDEVDKLPPIETQKDGQTVSKANQQKLNKIGEKLEKLYFTETNATPFAMGDTLIELETALKSANKLDKVSTDYISKWLKGNRSFVMTGQRISSLMLTAKKFPNNRNDKWSFKDHERARKIEQNLAGKEQRAELDGDALLAEYENGNRKFEKAQPTNVKNPTFTIRVEVHGDTAVSVLHRVRSNDAERNVQHQLQHQRCSLPSFGNEPEQLFRVVILGDVPMHVHEYADEWNGVNNAFRRDTQSSVLS